MAWYSRPWRGRIRDSPPTVLVRPRSASATSIPRLLYREWGRIEVSALASQVAYSLIFAIPSLILFAMALAALIDSGLGLPVADRLRDLIEREAPPSTKDLLTIVVDEAIARVGGGGASAGIVIAIVVAVWGGSGGVNALMNACNRAYGVRDTRNFVVKRLVAIWLTGVMTLLTVASAILFLGGQAIGEWTIDRFDLGDTFATAYRLARWSVTVLAVTGALVALYRLGTIVHPPIKWALPGALLATGAWLLLLWGFQGVLAILDPGTPYGATGSLLALLLFLYCIAIVFILGAAANGLLIRRFAPGRLPPLDEVRRP